MTPREFIQVHGTDYANWSDDEYDIWFDFTPAVPTLAEDLVSMVGKRRAAELLSDHS